MAHQRFLSDLAVRGGEAANQTPPATIETRFLYNQDFDSIYAQVPGSLALLLVIVPAILMALAIVREKELGSITNLYVTPVTRIEFLPGKQLPYIAISMVNFGLFACSRYSCSAFRSGAISPRCCSARCST